MFGVTGLHFDQLKTNYTTSDKKWDYGLKYFFWLFNWIVGHLLGGIVFFGLIGWVGSVISPTARFYSIICLGLVCLIGAIHQFRIFLLPMPQLKRQVSRLWLNKLHKNTVALGYGFQLGSSVATRIKVATTYAVIGFAFCSASLMFGAIMGGIFGFSRAILPILLAQNNTSPGESLAFALRFNSYDTSVQRINGVALLLSGIALYSSIFYS